MTAFKICNHKDICLHGGSEIPPTDYSIGEDFACSHCIPHEHPEYMCGRPGDVRCCHINKQLGGSNFDTGLARKLMVTPNGQCHVIT